MRRSRAPATVVLLALLVLSGCGSSSPRAVGEEPTTSSEARPPTVAPPTTVPPPTAPPTTTAPASTPAPDPALDRVGLGAQAVVVRAGGYGATVATLSGYERASGVWRQVFGPWRANLGAKGLAPPGAKREGDGRTPSGVYGFDFLFGVSPDPGVSFGYRRVTSPAIVWDDDPASPRYNTWVDLDAGPAGADPEPMYTRPAYDYGAVIAYNPDRTPGLGSAIFLHVSTGGPTAGCVSLPADQLVELLRWLDPTRQPRIVLTAG